MKPLSKKDLVIISLFFFALFAASSLAVPAMILKDIPYQTMLAQNPVIYIFSSIGYVLTLPVLMIFITPIHFLNLMGVTVVFDSFYSLIPILTALIYSSVLVVLLAMYNNQSKKISKKT